MGGGGVKDLKLKSKSDKGIMKTCMKEVPFSITHCTPLNFSL